MREIAHNWISPVRIKVNASQIAVATAGAAQSEDRSAKQKTTFFDSIGHSPLIRSAPISSHDRNDLEADVVRYRSASSKS